MIIVNNEEALRVKCENVLVNEIGPLIDLLERELENSERLGRPGIGLAAPQVGIAKNIAIVRLDNIKINLVNCKIKKAYDKMMFSGEGCLSFPGRIEDTMRYQEVYVVDNLTYPYNFEASGLVSIVVQHELDHFDGRLLPDIAIAKPKKKVGPNDLCPCGQVDLLTGKIKKFKKCCGK